MTGASWARLILVAAGGLGSSGVAIGAAGAHAAGGELARLASEFLLIHAAAAIAVTAWAQSASRPRFVLWSASLLVVGCACFSGDLAVVAFTGSHVLRWLAPTGGMILIAGWIAVSVSALVQRSD